ncbi:MAG: leucyl aminopeptidase [Mycobacteriales bacterium]
MPVTLSVLTGADLLTRTDDLLAVPVYAGPAPSPEAVRLADALDIDLEAFLAKEKAKGEAGEFHSLPSHGRIPAGALLLVGMGDRAALTSADFRKAGAQLARRVGSAASVATTISAGASADQRSAFAEGVGLAAYKFTSYKSDPKPSTLVSVTVIDGRPATETPAAVERAAVRVDATTLARDLVNTPSLDKTPEWLARAAIAAGKRAGIRVAVLGPAELAAQGFGGIVGVGQGSTRGPRLIEMEYAPAGARSHVVLVGKGITFDSGGLSLKPNDGMVTMKTDMSGGAAVIAVLEAAARLELPVRVTGLVAAAENMISGTAQRVSDVISQYGGTTVEVLNTDAEGRLVLADALAYADAELAPDFLVDLATLTGAMPIALGRKCAGLFANDDRLADALLKAADAAGEKLWRMPIVEDYRSDLDSEVADLRNIGHGKIQGGSIIAALFLREFVGKRKWAHLDIAGPARADGDDDEICKGGTGYGVRTLLTWLETIR